LVIVLWHDGFRQVVHRKKWMSLWINNGRTRSSP
jgi:hypothetical protein